MARCGRVCAGWRRLQVLLPREGVHVNHKKLRRLYIEERLQVRRRAGRKRALGTRVPIVLPQGGSLAVLSATGCSIRNTDGGK